jgi:hypothetical protein
MEEEFKPKKLGIENVFIDGLAKYRKRAITIYFTQPITLKKIREMIR